MENWFIKVTIFNRHLCMNGMEYLYTFTSTNNVVTDVVVSRPLVDLFTGNGPLTDLFNTMWVCYFIIDRRFHLTTVR